VNEDKGPHAHRDLADPRLREYSRNPRRCTSESEVKRPRVDGVDVHTHLGGWLTHDRWLLFDTPAFFALMDECMSRFQETADESFPQSGVAPAADRPLAGVRAGPAAAGAGAGVLEDLPACHSRAIVRPARERRSLSCLVAGGAGYVGTHVVRRVPAVRRSVAVRVASIWPMSQSQRNRASLEALTAQGGPQ
jgi:hypothetical protein